MRAVGDTVPPMDLESVKATLEAARADVDAERDRTDSLDRKLTNIAAFAGLSLSISGAVGGTVLAAGRLNPGFTIALGSVLSLAAVLFLASVIACFVGLAPKPYEGIADRGARKRISRKRLERPPEEVLRILANTYYLKFLPQARQSNHTKVRRVKIAFWFVGGGFAILRAHERTRKR